MYEGVSVLVHRVDGVGGVSDAVSVGVGACVVAPVVSTGGIAVVPHVGAVGVPHGLFDVAQEVVVVEQVVVGVRDGVHPVRVVSQRVARDRVARGTVQ